MPNEPNPEIGQLLSNAPVPHEKPNEPIFPRNVFPAIHLQPANEPISRPATPCG